MNTSVINLGIIQSYANEKNINRIEGKDRYDLSISMSKKIMVNQTQSY